MAVHPTAVVDPASRVHETADIGPFCVIGPDVEIGARSRLLAHVYVEGPITIGEDNTFSPYSTVGISPQDLKYHGERTETHIGHRNLVREFVTIHRGTEGGGGTTSLGDDNLLQAYAHVAHDCHVGNRTLFGNGATAGGHVVVEDEATISAYSGVHQFCRVGRQAFIGGYSVVTKDALPYGKTVGNRARIYGLNTIGLVRRGFSPATITKLKRAYRYLLQSKLNTTRAMRRIVEDETVACPEVRYLLEFIRTSKRGVNLRRPPRRMEPVGVDE